MKKLHKAIISALGAAALTSIAPEAFAMGVEEVNLGVFTGTSISSSGHDAVGKKGWADGTASSGFGWVHTGTSYTKLQVGSAADINNGVTYDMSFKTTAQGIAGSTALDNPAFTIWTSGTSDFNLGASNFGLHTYDPIKGPTGSNAPLAAIGITDIVGYVNSGPNSFTSLDGIPSAPGWVNTSTPAVTNAANSSWSSTQTAGLDYAMLNIAGLKAGYYLIGVGGSCIGGCTTGGGFQWDISGTVSAAPVPVPAAAWLFGGAIASLAGATRRKRLLPA